jgi:hypothetical protein
LTPNQPSEEQILYQHLSQLPPPQRQAALMRIAQQQRQAGFDERELAGRLAGLSFSPSEGGAQSIFPGPGTGTVTPVSGESDMTQIGSARPVSPSSKSNVLSSPATVRGDLAPVSANLAGTVSQQQPSKKGNLDTIPHAVQLRILGYLKPGRFAFSDVDPPSPSPTRDLHALLRVSRKLHFATVPVLWSRLILRSDPHVRSCIASVARRVQWQGPGGSLAIWTRSIEVWGAVAAEVASALRVVVMEATREPQGGIRELALTCAPGMDEYILFRMFESTEPVRLETLRLRGAGVTDRMCGMITMWCRHIQSLEIISGSISGESLSCWFRFRF